MLFLFRLLSLRKCRGSLAVLNVGLLKKEKMLVMECVGRGARNFSAMAASFCPSRTRRIRKSVPFSAYRLRRRSFLVTANAAGSESCVAVKRGFADEEDYVKGGGSELLFVQMQQNKRMEMQSKLSDKVTSFSFSLSVSFFRLYFLLNFFQFQSCFRVHNQYGWIRFSVLYAYP